MRRRSRRSIAPERAAFDRVLQMVEAAKEDLLLSVPSARGVPQRPLAESLVAFELSLRAAAEAMPTWRTSETGDAWRRCDDALRTSLDVAERLRLEAPALDYESLVGVLADLIDPLLAFDVAHRAVAT